MIGREDVPEAADRVDHRTAGEPSGHGAVDYRLDGAMMDEGGAEPPVQVEQEGERACFTERIEYAPGDR